ncbi:MAG: hypothetical protein KH290_01090 [Roseburia sp.]|nr:hypothetical protein [Roseburia sp.]
MKRIKKYLFLLLTAILLFAQPVPQVQAFTTTAATGQVKLNKKSLTIAYTKIAKLKLKNAPAKVAWYSSNTKIAYCDAGTVEARSVGKVKITAKCRGISYTCTVTVTSGENAGLTENGRYTSKNKVAAYIRRYGKLPSNFITKSEASELGWNGGSLLKYSKYACIGGNIYHDYEGVLPKAAGRKYYECDIDTMGALSRGAKRIIYSNDGLIYYTDNHYNHFKQL